MEIRQKTSIKHQDFLVWCYKASDDNFDKLYFFEYIWDRKLLRYMTTKIWHSLIHIDCPSSIRWKIIMISVIFLRGQTCETRKKRFLHFSDVENARNILLCNNRFMVSKYVTSTLKTKYFTFDLFTKTFIRILNPLLFILVTLVFYSYISFCIKF